MARPSAGTWALLALLGASACGKGAPERRPAEEGAGSEAAQGIAQHEWDFLRRTNEARHAQRLPPLRMAPRLVTVARDWSARMASTQELGPNPALSGQSHRAENVGHGVSVAYLEAAFWNSPHHRDNNYVGIGVVSSSSGTVWVTLDFVKSEDALATVVEPLLDEGAVAAAPRASSSPGWRWVPEARRGRHFRD